MIQNQWTKFFARRLCGSNLPCRTQTRLDHAAKLFGSPSPITVGVEQNVTDERNYACAPAPDPTDIWSVFTNAKDVFHLHEDRRFGYRRRRQTKFGIHRGGQLLSGPLMGFWKDSWT